MMVISHVASKGFSEPNFIMVVSTTQGIRLLSLCKIRESCIRSVIHLSNFTFVEKHVNSLEPHLLHVWHEDVFLLSSIDIKKVIANCQHYIFRILCVEFALRLMSISLNK